jgi:hypothetical protein
MRNRNFISVVLGFMILVGCEASASPQQRRAGHETGNGGTVLVDGTEYKLADLHFKAAPHDRYRMDDELVGLLGKIKKEVNDIWGVQFVSPQKDFFNEEVFSSLVEYRFVSRLPGGCSFIPDENLPAGLPRIDLGCTQGSLTYLLPAEFSRLTLLQKALLIIHERLHTFAPNEPYEIKASIVSALYVLMTRYVAKIEAEEFSSTLLPEDLAVLNLFPVRYAQLAGDVQPRATFLPSGAILKDGASVGTGVRLGFGAIIDDLRIEGGDILIENSNLNCDYRDARVIATQLVIKGSQGCVTGSIDRGLIVNSKFELLATAINDLWIEGSVVRNRQSIGRSYRFENSEVSGSISAPEVEVIRAKLQGKVSAATRVRLVDVQIEYGWNFNTFMLKANEIDLERFVFKTTAAEYRENAVSMEVASMIRFRDVQIVNSWSDLRAQALDWSDVYIAGAALNITGGDVHFSSVRLEGQEPKQYWKLISSERLRISNIALLKVEGLYPELKFSGRGGLVLDGLGRNFKVKGNRRIGSQRDLDRLLAP